MINCNHEFCLSESSTEGTLLYLRNHLSYKCQNDLCIYKATELGSSFDEISNPKKSNIITGCISRHPSRDLNEFCDNYLNNLLDKISMLNEFVFLLGDLNVGLSYMISMHQQRNCWNHFLQICFPTHCPTNYNSGQNIWNKKRNPVKLDRARKVWYLLLCVFDC